MGRQRGRGGAARGSVARFRLENLWTNSGIFDVASRCLDPSGEGAILSLALAGTRRGGFSSRAIRGETNPSLTSEQLGGHENVRPWYGCTPGSLSGSDHGRSKQLVRCHSAGLAGCSRATKPSTSFVETSRDSVDTSRSTGRAKGHKPGARLTAPVQAEALARGRRPRPEMKQANTPM